MTIHGRILMMDNLRRRNVIVVNACPLCLSDEESVDHLLLNCKVAREGIQSLVVLVEAGVFPRKIDEPFDAWKFAIGSSKGKIL